MATNVLHDSFIHFFHFVFQDKPEKPKIQGELNIRVGDVATLKCSSRSTSAPDYYQKIARLSYSWFHNEKQMVEKTTDTIEINVTKDHKFNNYSCIAKEILKSDRSDQVQINPLCKTPFFKLSFE